MNRVPKRKYKQINVMILQW